METEQTDAASKKRGLKRPLVFVALISAFGSSFQYGYNFWVVNYPAVLLQDFNNETYLAWNKIRIDRSVLMFTWGLTVTFFPIGGLVGSLLAGPLVDTCGRKSTLLSNNILSILSAFLMGFSKVVPSYEFVLFARFIIGISAGISSSVVPMYLAEMAPQNLRGAVSMVAHLFFTIGILVTQILGLHEVLGTNKGWPILLSLTGIPAVLQIFLLPSFPESPRYLLIQRRDEENARKALKRLRGQDDVEHEIEELHREDLAEKAEKEMSVFKIVRFRGLRWQLLSVVVLMFGQQLSGVSAAYFYMKVIYLSTGIGEHHIQYISVAITAILVFLTIIVLCVVDIWGRRPLLLTGFGICGISCVLLTMSLELQNTIPWMAYFSTVFLMFFLCGHTIGPAPIPNVMTAEMFLQSSRSSAYVIGGFVHWLCNFLIVFVYLHIEIRLWNYSFLIFLPVCVATFYYIFKVIPETKNRTFLDIQGSWQSIPAHRPRGREQVAEQKLWWQSVLYFV